MTCSTPCPRRYEKYVNCICSKAVPSPIGSYQRHYVTLPMSLLQLSLMDGKHNKVVLFGKEGKELTTHVETLYHGGGIPLLFDAIARASPSRICGVDGFPIRELEGLLRDLNPGGINREGMSKMELIQDIQLAMQQKNRLVILTNVEDVNHHSLNYLDTVFRSHSFGVGSKLLITSTNEQMLESRDNELFLHISQLAPKYLPLSEKRRPPPTTLKNKGYVEALLELALMEDKYKKVASENLVFVAKSSVGMGMAKCSPSHALCLVMLGGLLAMKDSLAEWEAISSSNMQYLPQIFQLCYSDLPHHLKHCLLSLLNLPEDIELPTKKLYRMWIAVGFVQFSDDVVHSGESLQSITEAYLTELVQRGFVKVGKRRSNGKIKTCRLQFALQELCIDKAREENFLIIVHPSESLTSESNYNSATKQLAVHLNSTSTANQEELCALINSFNSLNSLMFYPNVVDPFLKRKSRGLFIKICNHIHSLRILDLEGMWMTKGSLPEEVGNLVSLRYLSLKGTWVNQLPLSISKLTHLQTLDLRVRKSLSIPNILWKFKYLIHLYLPNVLTRRRAKLQLCGLDHLQTLVNLQTSRVHLSHLLKLRCLKKLSLRKIHLHGVKTLDDILNFLGRSLEVTIDGAVINASPYILSSFRNLYKLKIKGMLSVTLCPEMFPPHLEELALKHTKLEQDPIPVLETLPRLESLYFGHESFLGKKMTFSGDFHALKHLKLCSLSNLEILDRNPENDMCNLESIVIRDCWRVQVNLPVKDLQQRTLDI